jgi:hypothetical protein
MTVIAALTEALNDGSVAVRRTAIRALALPWPTEGEDDSADSGSFTYPEKVNLAPLAILHPARQTNWVRVETTEDICWQMARREFFANGDELTIRVGEDKESAGHDSWVKLTRADDPKSEVTFPVEDVVLYYGTRPASFHDFDGNGLCDIKLVFYTGGNGGFTTAGQVFYLFQSKTEWRMISFYVRDVSYTWECDLDGDGRYELLKAHHQDKETKENKWVETYRDVREKLPAFAQRVLRRVLKPVQTYRNAKRKSGAKPDFEKYLFINAYKVEPTGLKLCNNLSKSLPKVFPFGTEDPFDITHDAAFMKFNQFALPDGYTNQVRRIPLP